MYNLWTFWFTLAHSIFLGEAIPEDRMNRRHTISYSSSSHRSLKNGPNRHNLTRHVVLILKDASVSETRASLKRKTRRNETIAIVKKLKAKQDAVISSVEMCGGTIMQQYQYALNGMRITINKEHENELKSLPDVVDILPVKTYKRMNVQSVSSLGVPKIWNSVPWGLGLHGEGVKVGIIDTGIDYTHANFGGPGTLDAFNKAKASSTLTANSSLFGSTSPKVKGGYDFAGDAYNGNNIPIPDPNPLDCQGHGSHVAGTVGGFGVKLDGTTYTGIYNQSIYTPNAFLIGPGVAPNVDLYAYRIFGCDGASTLLVDAIDRAIADDMDVINISLGSDFGFDDDFGFDNSTKYDAGILASNNAFRAGIVVVAAGGNSGSIPYITSAPGSADGAISVAATRFINYVNLTANDGKVIPLQLSNNISFDGGTYTLISLFDKTSSTGYDETLGCNRTDYPYPEPILSLIVVKRGICGRVTKALNGQDAGMAATLMVNDAPGYPPYEGMVTGLKIPFFGVDASYNSLLEQLNGTQVTLTATGLTNIITDFSSSGPRGGDSFLKPDIAAPGYEIISTAVGTGKAGISFSGTSMASPYVAGVAALIRQTHPTWTAFEIKSAIISTANRNGILGFAPRYVGAGVVNALAAAQTSVIVSAFPSSDHFGSVAINFGYIELTSTLFSSEKLITLSNHGSNSISFLVQVGNVNGAPHALTLTSSIVLDGYQNLSIALSLQVPAATAGISNGFVDASGMIIFTPLGSGNNAIPLCVPYYIVPRSVSSSIASIQQVTGDASVYNISVSNSDGPIASQSVNLYSWGIHSDDPTNLTYASIRAVGVTSKPNPNGSVTNPVIEFALNTYKPWSSPSVVGFSLHVDVDPQNRNGIDYIVWVEDFSLITEGLASGSVIAYVESTRSLGYSTLGPGATYTSGSVVIFSILRTFLCRSLEPCLSQANPRFSYYIQSYDVLYWYLGIYQTPRGLGWFNPFTSSISFTSSQLGPIDRGKSNSSIAKLNVTESTMTPVLGVLVVVVDNKSGKDQAIELAFPTLSKTSTTKPTMNIFLHPSDKPSFRFTQKTTASNFLPSKIPTANPSNKRTTTDPYTGSTKKPSTPTALSITKTPITPLKPSTKPSTRSLPKPTSDPTKKSRDIPSSIPTAKPISDLVMNQTTHISSNPSAKPSTKRTIEPISPSRKPTIKLAQRNVGRTIDPTFLSLTTLVLSIFIAI